MKHTHNLFKFILNWSLYAIQSINSHFGYNFSSIKVLFTFQLILTKTIFYTFFKKIYIRKTKALFGKRFLIILFKYCENICR